MSDHKAWLERTSARASGLSDAYQRKLAKLWWANLMFVVVPAVLTTAAAIFAAIPKEETFSVFGLPAASAFAGIAAVLTAIHKALKCDDHQAECLRLSQAYQGMAIDAESAASAPQAQHDSLQSKSLLI
jgi:hypothetical protein